MILQAFKLSSLSNPYPFYPALLQYIYCSSAGVYLKSDQMPHRETDATDVKSRHKGKLDTESYLQVWEELGS